MRYAKRRWYLKNAPRLAWNILAKGQYDFSMDLMPMHSTRMPIAKRLNLARSALNLFHRSSKPSSMPINLQIEVTNRCNLRCPVCPSGLKKLKRPTGDLDLDLYRDFLKETGPYALSAMLWGWGEPLLHPRFSEIVRMTRSYGIIPYTSTNGQALSRDHVIEGLLSDPCDYLVIAVDGLTDETLSTYRVGARLAPILDGVKRLVEGRRRLGLDKPILHMRYIVMKHNQHELPDVENFARRHGFDQLAIRALSQVEDDSSLFENMKPDLKKYNAFAYNGGKRIHRSDFWCQHAFAMGTLFVDGSIPVCDQDYNLEAPFGVMGKDVSFKDVWYGRQAHSVRRVVRERRTDYSFCRRCPYADRDVNTCSIANIDLK